MVTREKQQKTGLLSRFSAVFDGILCDYKTRFRLNQAQVRILAELRNNPNTTKAYLMKTLKLGKSSVETGLAVLKKYGYVERVGSRRAGYWKVLK